VTSGLPAHLAALSSPHAYPHPVSAVQVIETHVSWILLTGGIAYKIKRPVRYPFVDLSTLERRAFFCAEELRLNRRFARQLYLDVCQVTQTGGIARIGGGGAVVEHAVRMRQFDGDQELDRLLTDRRIEPAELGAFGRELAEAHEHLPAADGADPWGRPETVRRIVLENLEECARAASVFDAGTAVSSLRQPLLWRLEADSPRIAVRLAGGRVRECHGDLHTRNIVRLGGRLIAFDCMEFEPAFRWIDVAEEVASLLADLHGRGFPLHAQAFLNGYLARSGDYPACRLLGLYTCHHALVRAKVGALAAAPCSGAEASEQARARFMACVDAARRAFERRPRMLLMTGLSGSGKTWLASRLAGPLGAIHLRSDVERKRLAGLDEAARSASPPGEDLYTRAASARMYGHLASCAEEVLSGGCSVIVDATFILREDRAAFARLALRLGVVPILLHCRAPTKVLAARIARRRARGADASEADLAVLEWQVPRAEPVAAEEGFQLIEVDTVAASELSLGDLLARLQPAP
jgi:aminoglycoside phosphotransferase family enzyme/predicted kinase